MGQGSNHDLPESCIKIEVIDFDREHENKMASVVQFDRASSGLAGLSFEEGLFPVFGYVTNVSLFVQF